MVSRFRMSLRFFLLRLKLAVLLVLQVWVVDQWILILTLQLPVLFAMQWFLMGEHYVWLIGLYAGFLVARIARIFLAKTSDEAHDAPYTQKLAAQPRLAEYLNETCREFREPKYRRIAFVLSNNPWRRFGCDASELRRQRRTAVVSIGSLRIYSMFDLRCELAYSLVRARSALLIPAAQRSLDRVAQLTRIAEAKKRGPFWQRRLMAAWNRSCKKTLAIWNFMADIQADGKVAQRYGSFAVSSWVQRSLLADISVADSLSSRLGPLAEVEGVLLPVAATCEAFYHLVEPEWLRAMRQHTLDAEKGQASAFVFRLAALQHGLQASGGLDPRPAASLIEDLPTLEKAAMQHELGAEGRELKRVEEKDIAEAVLVPLMRRELERNSALIGGWTLRDLPDLARRRDELAARYVTDSHSLLNPEQKKSLMPDLLASFLTVKLIDAGGVPLYAAGEGVCIQIGSKTVEPSTLIDQLVTGDLDAAGFAEALALEESD